MRKPKEVFSPKKGPGTITLTGIHGKIRYLGSTIPASAVGSCMDHTSITISPKKNTKGLIAIQAVVSGVGVNDYLLEVDYFGKEPTIDLNDAWFPSAYRLGQINGVNIQVNIDGQWYTTNYNNLDNVGGIVVQSGDILCGYLYGILSKTDVEKAAAEKTFRQQIADMRMEIKKLNGANKHANTVADQWNDMRIRANLSCEEAYAKLDELKKKLISITDFAAGLFHAVNSRGFGKGGRIKEALYRVPAEVRTEEKKINCI